MLELSFIRNNKDRVIKGLKLRNYSDEDLRVVDEILKYDEERRTCQYNIDSHKAEAKKLSKEIGGLMKTGKVAEAEAIKSKVAELKSSINGTMTYRACEFLVGQALSLSATHS